MTPISAGCIVLKIYSRIMARKKYSISPYGGYAIVMWIILIIRVSQHMTFRKSSVSLPDRPRPGDLLLLIDILSILTYQAIQEGCQSALHAAGRLRTLVHRRAQRPVCAAQRLFSSLTGMTRLGRLLSFS